MHAAIKTMLEKYYCHSEQDYVNALKEIFQEIALLGLWRAKFYEKAAFYGGTALRILYGLDRFSEDLDFTLLKPDTNFDFTPYNQAIADELSSFGFQVTVEVKNKTIETNIESAFIKATTKQQLIIIEANSEITDRVHHMNTIKIKMEIDTFPPGHCETEVKKILLPIPFSVKTLSLPDLFAGKIHAILCRPWQKRVKGRDWYDLVWYIARNVSVNLDHLRDRLIQSEAWSKNKLRRDDLLKLLIAKINQTDFENAKLDILPFIKDKQVVDLWSKDFFIEIIQQLV
ncbi:MAG: nucleotidyl transferase AbiEii/AbiGii toxin family protein [Gammaproteobacteria bacterium]|nr:MAG: nucleotidyl transferase AbiEii/AbiGii toxin family protein [Gammaproteobacteria bacterium]